MKKLKKLMAILLIASMTAALFCASAMAENTKEYTKYVALGDSIPSGTGLKEDGKEIFHKTVSETYNIGKGFTKGSYPDLIADEYNIAAENCYFGSRPGMRSTELRYILEDGFADTDEGKADAKYRKFFQLSWGGIAVAEDLNGRTEEFKTEIQGANLITLNYGSNDIIIPAVCDAMKYFENSEDTNYTKMLQGIQEIIQKFNSGYEGLAQMIKTSQTLGLYAELIAVVTDAMNRGEQQFYRDWDAIIKDIRELNDHADIIALGLYNPMAGYVTYLGEALGETLNTLLGSVFNRMSRYVHYTSEQRFQYNFVDVSEMGDYVANGGTYDKAHPDQDGHKIISEKIKTAITKICRHWEWVNDAEQVKTHTHLTNEKEASFLSPGYTGDLVCDDCGEIIKQGTVVTALGFKINLPDNFSVRLSEAFSNLFTRLRNILSSLFKRG